MLILTFFRTAATIFADAMELRRGMRRRYRVVEE